MFRKNFMKEKLESGKSVIGTWCIIPSPVVTDIICSSGLDFIIIDAEHGPISFETAQEMVMVCESRKVSPLLRVGNIDEGDILKALDIGVHGIQIPNVNSVEDVEQIIQFSKYPPNGNRGFSPFTRAGDYSITNSTTLTKTANENVLVGINVEGEEAINNIDQILSIKELDLVFIGLFDLSKALGVPGQVDDKRVLDYLKDLTTKIIKAGKYPGTIATSKEKMKYFLSIDVRFILYLVDCEMLKSSYTTVVDEFVGIIK
jgi:4-hydroxy-2-oxoheptanedioate aldolase